MAEEPPETDTGETPTDETGSDPPPPAEVGPPPEGEEPAFGLDDAWERLSGTGRGVVVLLAMALVIGASVGIGLLVGREDESGGETVVLAETAGTVVTVEGPSETEEVPTATDIVPVPVPVPGETETDLVPVPVPGETETDLVPVPVPGETVTEELPDTTGEAPSGATFVFSSEDPGPDIGPTSVEARSLLAWNSEGGQFTLVDRASGDTIVDSIGVAGGVPIEAGQYDFEVTEASEEWGIVITAQ